MNIYGLLIMIGVFVGTYFYYQLCRKFKIPTNDLLENIFIIFLVGLVGARATYIILYPEQFSSFYEVLAIWQGGLVSYGGVISGILAALLEFRGKHLILKLNLLAPCFFVGWIFGRIGGFLTQNAVGISSHFYGPSFYNRIPIQLFESLLSLLIVILSVILLFKIDQKFVLKYPIICVASLGDYALGRFIIDFWRDDPKIPIGLQFGQIISFFIFFCCIMILLKIIRSQNIFKDHSFQHHIPHVD